MGSGTRTPSILNPEGKMYCVRVHVGGSVATDQLLGPYTRVAAQELVAEFARQQTGREAFYAYVMRWPASNR